LFNTAQREPSITGNPVIGYYGAIDDWFDVDTVAYILATRPSWTMILIGRVRREVAKELSHFRNVQLLGEKLYWELPRLLQRFDVCIIPFKKKELINATDPVKFYEMMAAGKPIVASEIPELLGYQNLCYIARSKEEFVEKIQIASKENDPALRAKRVEFAKANTWEIRYLSLRDRMESLDLL
jgi:glycosyltransferase involved in cell wall biosynthesis